MILLDYKHFMLHLTKNNNNKKKKKVKGPKKKKKKKKRKQIVKCMFINFHFFTKKLDRDSLVVLAISHD
jgi:hypothetical protein